MFGKSVLAFKAQIKVGASIGHDHGYYLWPNAAHPRNPPVTFYPEMEFDAEFVDGRYFSLRRPGYGGKPDYGNGSIFVNDIADLIVSDGDRQQVVDYLAGEKRKQIEKASADLMKLHAELGALSFSSGIREGK